MNNSKNTSRRSFIAKTGLVAAGVAIGAPSISAASYSRIMGANDKIRTGFIGLGNRGSQLLNMFMTDPSCEVAALCDVYKPYMLRDRSLVESRWLKDRSGQIPQMGEKFSGKPALYDDWRKLLEDKSIDAVVIATPDHWHAIQMIEAVKAGKDVYCEKPLTATIKEGRAMVNAQKATNRVVQVGLNRRGNVVYQTLKKEIGKIGKISVARAARVSDMWPNGIGKLKPEQPPKDFNWDMWLGPRAFRPYQYNIAPYMFRWWSDYSSQMGNWGVHYMDAIRWMMGEVAPVAITSVGDKYVLDHDADIPDTMQVTFEFASKAMVLFNVFEGSGGSVIQSGEIEFKGAKGTVIADQRSGYQIIPSRPGQFQNWDNLQRIEAENFKSTMPINVAADGSDESAVQVLIRDFYECIKSRKEPLCPLEEGHRSTSFAHLANIALKVKQRLEWDPEKEVFLNSKEANEMLSYEYRKPWTLPKV